MGRRISHEKWEKYAALRAMGVPYSTAAKEVGISRSAADDYEKGRKSSSGLAVKQAKEAAAAAEKPPVPHHELPAAARAALEDFGLFRRRYFGRIPSPWQEDAAMRMVEFLETPHKEFVVVNVAPGSGKSTLFAHDLVCFMLARDRSLRCMIGSYTEKLARKYTGRIRRSLERTRPILGDDAEVAKGRELHAEATLVGDFGGFRPPNNDVWRIEEFIVAQLDDQPVEEKEPSVVAYGQDSGFLGGRFDLVVWDDLVVSRSTRTAEAREQQREWFSTEAETRVEPGGLLILQGQRIHSEDLYRYALDLEGEPAEDGTVGRKYHHIVYPAHHEESCEEKHDLTDPPWPEGCLIDPVRLPWRELTAIRRNKEQRFRVVYQQEDADPDTLLVQKAWIDGTGEHPGCWDKDRGLEPPKGLAPPVLSIATADPSPTRFWAIAWWLYHPDTEQRFLVDLVRQAMDASDFLDWNYNQSSFTGLMEEWQARSVDMGHPITHWVVEINAAQRFMLQYDHVRRWQAKHSVNIVPHSTARNKADPTMGVTSIAPHYQYGRVRLPGRGEARTASLKLVDEVTRWPEGSTDDCVPAGTTVTTRTGPKPIEQVVGGEMVLTHKGRWREVERTGQRPERDALYTVKAAGALPLRLTGNHPLLVCRGWREGSTKRERYDLERTEWVKAADLAAAGRHHPEPVALVTPFDTTVVEPVPVDLAELLTIQPGRGSGNVRVEDDSIVLASRRRRIPRRFAIDEDAALLIGLYLAEGSTSDHAIAFAAHADHDPIHEFVTAAAERLFGARVTTVRAGNGVALHVQSTAATRYFARFGKSDEKALPTDMLRWPTHLQRAILRGWLIGDGSASATQLRGVSISRSLLWQMETLAARCGYRTALRPHQAPRDYLINGRTGRTRQSWVLQMPGAAADLDHPLDAWRWSGLRPPLHQNSGIQVYPGVMLRKLRSVTVEPWEGTVYNLQVAEDESYVAEGVAVHNCVMAHWFLEWNLPNIWTANTVTVPRMWRPTWMKAG